MTTYHTALGDAMDAVAAGDGGEVYFLAGSGFLACRPDEAPPGARRLIQTQPVYARILEVAPHRTGRPIDAAAPAPFLVRYRAGGRARAHLLRAGAPGADRLRAGAWRWLTLRGGEIVEVTG